MVFKKVFGFNETKATKHMMEVHQLGKSVLWIGEREQAENYAYQLQRWKLQTILEKMIEFSLRIEPKIISSILPELVKYFFKSREL